MRWFDRSEAPALLRSFLARSHFDSGDVRLVFIKLMDRLVTVTGRVELGVQGPEQPIVHSYPGLLIYRSQVSGTLLDELLCSLPGEAVAHLPGLGQVTLKADWQSAYIVSAHERFGYLHLEWPSVVLVAQLDVSNDAIQAIHSNERVFGDGPLYPDFRSAVAHQIFDVDEPGRGLDYVRELVVVVPDLRARIASIRLEGPTLDIETEFGLSEDDGDIQLSLDLYLRTTKGTEHASFRVGTGHVQYEAQAPIMGVLADLSDARKEIIDEFEAGLRLDAPPDPRLVSSPTQRRLETEAAIRGGEGPRTEFKRALPKEEQDFVESVCAFANTEGGLIIVGVNDDATVAGYDPPSSEIDRVTNIVGHQVDPKPPFMVERVDLPPTVLLVHVQQGPNPPYLANGTLFIRSGATDRRMSRADLDQVRGPSTR